MAAAEAVPNTPNGDGDGDKKKKRNYRRKKKIKETGTAPVVPINDAVAQMLAERVNALPDFDVLQNAAAMPKALPIGSGVSFKSYDLLVVDGKDHLVIDHNPLTDIPAYEIKFPKKPELHAYPGVLLVDHKAGAPEPVRAHPHDVYRLIGELVVKKFDDAKIILSHSNQNNWDAIFGKERVPEISKEPFDYDRKTNASPIPLDKVNLNELPKIMAYEGAMKRIFADEPYFSCTDLLMHVQKMHYQSHVKDDPKKPYRTFKRRANDQDIEGHASHKMLEDIRRNGIVIGYKEDNAKKKRYVERFLTPEVKSMNMRDAFFITAGIIFEKRIRTGVAQTKKNARQAEKEETAAQNFCISATQALAKQQNAEAAKAAGVEESPLQKGFNNVVKLFAKALRLQ